MKFDEFMETVKYALMLKPIRLTVQYTTCNVKINLVKKNYAGITSNTFHTLISPEFTPKTNRHENGMKITTLIDKKNGCPVLGYVAKFEQEDPNAECYDIMVEDKAGDFEYLDKHYTIVGSTYFYINQEKQMVMPKLEKVFINGELYEKASSYMRAPGNKDFAGIGTRLHQIRIERMLQSKMGNSFIIAEGDSFPFHYSMGYRLAPSTRDIKESIHVLREFSDMNKKSFKQNLEFLFAEKQKSGEFIINWSATLEHFLCDYYRNGGKPLENFSPNMFLNPTSLKQWIAMIQKQPILY